MRAVVISGGGSKGAFAVGVVNRLFREFPGLDFDLFVGTSTGALIVPLVAMKEMGLLEKVYTTQKTENIVLAGRLGDRLGEHSIFDASPLWELLKANYTDKRYDDLQATGKKVFLTTVCLQTGELVVFTNTNEIGDAKNYSVRTLNDANHFRKAVMASACQPVFMPPVKVNKDEHGEAHPHFQYVDGGVREYAGIQMAIDNGATEIFTIPVIDDTKMVEDKEYGDLFSLLEKTIAIFSDDVGKNDLIVPNQYNDALGYIEGVKRKMKRSGMPADKVNEFFRIRGRENPYEDKLPIKTFTFRPSAPLGGGPGGLTFDPIEMKSMVRNGEATANDFIAALNPEDITRA